MTRQNSSGSDPNDRSSSAGWNGWYKTPRRVPGQVFPILVLQKIALLHRRKERPVRRRPPQRPRPVRKFVNLDILEKTPHRLDSIIPDRRKEANYYKRILILRDREHVFTIMERVL